MGRWRKKSLYLVLVTLFAIGALTTVSAFAADDGSTESGYQSSEEKEVWGGEDHPADKEAQDDPNAKGKEAEYANLH